MPFHPCLSGCGRFLSADDGHDHCLQCLGFQHAEDAFVDDSCVCCGRMSMISLRSRLSFMKGLAPSAATRADLSGSSRGSPADALGDLRVTVRASPPGTPPRTSYSSRSEHPIRFPGDFAGLSHGAPSISFGVPSADRMSIAASGDGLTSSEDEGAVGLPPSGVVATAAPDTELTAMLARAAVSIGLEVNRPPSPEPSRLDDWFLGAGRSSQPRPAPVPFFPEVHEELTRSWMAPFTARSPSSASSILTTLDGGVARGYAGIPQVERAIAVHLCPWNATIWRNRSHLPSKACKLTAAHAAKAYSAAGQAASALHAMAILQVHQAKALKQVHESSTDPGLMQEPNRYLGRRVEPLAGERRPPRPSQAPGRPGSRRSGPDAGNPEMLEFALSQETARTAPLLPLVEGREENLPFLFRFPVPTFSRKSNFLFLRVLRSMGRQCATPCFLTLPHDPFCQ